MGGPLPRSSVGHDASWPYRTAVASAHQRGGLRDWVLVVEGVGGDGADEFVEVGGRGDASELHAGEGGAELEAGAVLGRKLESGGAELFERMDVAAPEGDIALLLGAQALGVPLTR